MNEELILEFTSLYTTSISSGTSRVDDSYDPLGALLDSPYANTRFAAIQSTSAATLVDRLCEASYPHICDSKQMCPVLARATPMDIETLMTTSVRNHHTRFVPSVLECLVTPRFYDLMHRALGSRFKKYVTGTPPVHVVRVTSSALTDQICRAVFSRAINILYDTFSLERVDIPVVNIPNDIRLRTPTEPTDVAYVKSFIPRLLNIHPDEGKVISMDEIMFYASVRRQSLVIISLLNNSLSTLRAFLTTRAAMEKRILLYLNAQSHCHNRQWARVMEHALIQCANALSHRLRIMAQDYIEKATENIQRFVDLLTSLEELIVAGLTDQYNGIRNRRVSELAVDDDGGVSEVTRVLATEWADTALGYTIDSYGSQRAYGDVITVDSKAFRDIDDVVTYARTKTLISEIARYCNERFFDVNTSIRHLRDTASTWGGAQAADISWEFNRERQTRTERAPSSLMHMVMQQVSPHLEIEMSAFSTNTEVRGIYAFLRQMARRSDWLLGDCLTTFHAALTLRLLDAFIHGDEA